MKKEVFTLMGATASGKTALAMALANKFPVELISVDSALIYKSMDIGTAKPSKLELDRYPHQLIDILDPLESYSVARFVEDANQAIERAFEQNKIPLLVGGTMMYFNGLIEGLSQLPNSNEQIRSEIEELAQKKSWQFIHQKLAEVDPVSANRIHPNDPQRINRAYEIYLLTGKTMTELSGVKQKIIHYPIKQFALYDEDRSQLHRNIEKRFDLMLAQGFEQEVSHLMARGDLHLDLPSMRSVGYRQMWQYLLDKPLFDANQKQKKDRFEQMRFEGICATRQLAKRQITWLRGWKSPINWLTQQNGLDKITKEILSL